MTNVLMETSIWKSQQGGSKGAERLSELLDVHINPPLVNGNTLVVENGIWTNKPLRAPEPIGSGALWFNGQVYPLTLDQNQSVTIQHAVATNLQIQAMVWERTSVITGQVNSTLSFDTRTRAGFEFENDNATLFGGKLRRTLISGEWVELTNPAGFYADSLTYDNFSYGGYWQHTQTAALLGKRQGDSQYTLLAVHDDLGARQQATAPVTLRFTRNNYVSLRFVTLARYRESASASKGIAYMEVAINDGTTRVNPLFTSPAPVNGFSVSASATSSLTKYPAWRAFDGSKAGDAGWSSDVGIYPWDGGEYQGPTIALPGVIGNTVVNTNDASAIPLTRVTRINNITLSASLPVGTDIRYLLSFDGRQTWKHWNGSAWIIVNGTSLRERMDTAGNTQAEIQAGLAGYLPQPGDTQLDFAFDLRSTSEHITPLLDQINLNYDIASTYRQRVCDGVQYEAESISPTSTRITKLSAGSATIYPVIETRG